LQHTVEDPSPKPELQKVPGPVPTKERVPALDALRGVALLGILPMNIQAFSMIGAAYLNPTAYGDLQGANYWVWLLSHLFAELKFMAIFAMVFGAGIVLMTSRIEGSGRRSGPLHYRRMAWLLLFGLLHSYLLWYGDILLTYGLCGLVAFIFRKLAPLRLILMGLGLIAVATVIYIYFAWSIPHWQPQQVETFTREMWLPTPAMVQHELAAYRTGWLGEMHQRFHDATVLQVKGFIVLSFWRVEGLMLIGMALLKLGVFTGRCSSMLYWVFIVAGMLIGIPITYYGTIRDFATGWNMRQSFFLNVQYNYWASLLVALGWVGTVMLLCRSETLGALTKPVSAVGRMAFSNYILDTLICTSIFYGFGMGLFGKMNRVGQIEVVFTIWTFQLVVSPIWLRYFRFGPLEWLWRSLTYCKLQPFRQSKAT